MRGLTMEFSWCGRQRFCLSQILSTNSIPVSPLHRPLPVYGGGSVPTRPWQLFSHAIFRSAQRAPVSFSLWIPACHILPSSSLGVRSVAAWHSIYDCHLCRVG